MKNFLLALVMISNIFNYSFASEKKGTECNNSQSKFVTFAVNIDSKSEIESMELICESTKGLFEKNKAKYLEMFSNLPGFTYTPNTKQTMSLTLN